MPTHEAATPCGACTGGLGCAAWCKTHGYPHGDCAWPEADDASQCCACSRRPARSKAPHAACDPPRPPTRPRPPRNTTRPSTPAAAAASAAGADRSGVYLAFDTCGGLTNQRISLVQGLMLAHLMQATAVLPRLNANGLQRPSDRHAGAVAPRSSLAPPLPLAPHPSPLTPHPSPLKPPCFSPPSPHHPPPSPGVSCAAGICFRPTRRPSRSWYGRKCYAYATRAVRRATRRPLRLRCCASSAWSWVHHPAAAEAAGLRPFRYPPEHPSWVGHHLESSRTIGGECSRAAAHVNGY